MKQYKIPKLKLTYIADAGVADKAALKSSDKVADLFRQTYEEGEIQFVEYFKVLYLNRAYKPLGVVIHSMGSSANCLVEVKTLLAGALTAHADAIIISHNHPSGRITPSPQDDQITVAVRRGCEAVGLRLLDHIIVTADNYYSYNDNSRL